MEEELRQMQEEERIRQEEEYLASTMWGDDEKDLEPYRLARNEIKDKTELGNEISSIINAGNSLYSG